MGRDDGVVPKPLWMVLIACLAVQLCFGAYPVIVKAFEDEDTAPGEEKGNNFNLLVFCSYRDLLCTPFLFLAARFFEGASTRCLCTGSVRFRREASHTLLMEKGPVPLHPLSGREVALFFILGAMGIGLQQIFFIMGMHYTSPAVASIWQQVVPVWGFVFAVALGLERIPRPNTKSGFIKISGVLLSIFGACIMLLAGHKNKSEGVQSANHVDGTKLIGTLFLMINTTMTGFYLALQKKYIFNAKSSGVVVVDTGRWKAFPLHVTAWSYLFGSITALLFSLLGSLLHLETLQFKRGSKTDTWALPSSAIVPLLYAIIFTSAISYALLSFANQNAPSSLVSASWPLQVPVSILLSAIAGFATLTLAQGLGGVLIVLGLLFVCRSMYLDASRESQREETHRPSLEEHGLIDSQYASVSDEETSDDGRFAPQ